MAGGAAATEVVRAQPKGLVTRRSTARSTSLQRNLAWHGESYDASLLAELQKILSPVMIKQWDYDAGVEKLDK